MFIHGTLIQERVEFMETSRHDVKSIVGNHNSDMVMVMGCLKNERSSFTWEWDWDWDPSEAGEVLRRAVCRQMNTNRGA